MEIRNTIKQQCITLTQFNKNWWTRGLPGECGNANNRIEVSHIDGKEWIKCDYDTFMMIPLEETKYNEPDSIKTGQKRIEGVPAPGGPQIHQGDND